jgi:hypothetical protein
MAASDGGGAIGDVTGTTTIPSITIRGTTRRAGHFTTATITIEAEACTVEFGQELHSLPAAQHRGEFSVVPGEQSNRSTEVIQLPEATLNPAAKAEPARVPSATKATEEIRGAIHRAEAPVPAAGRAAAEVRERTVVGQATLAVEEGMVVAGTASQSLVRFLT